MELAIFDRKFGFYAKFRPSNWLQMSRIWTFDITLRSLSSLLGDLFREFWRGILGGVREGFGEVLGGQMKENNKGKRGKL